MRGKGHARKTIVLFSMCRLDSCGRRLAVRQDRVLDPPENDNNPKGAEGGQSQGAGGKKNKGKGKGKNKSDAARSKEGKGNIDMQALPAAVRRQLSRPRWSSDFLNGCCTQNP